MENQYDPALGRAAEALAKKWHTCDIMAVGSKGPSGASSDDIKDWSSEMLVAFLDKLASYRAKQPMHRKTTRQMAELYGLDSSKNAEIKGSWYKLAINAGLQPMSACIMSVHSCPQIRGTDMCEPFMQVCNLAEALCILLALTCGGMQSVTDVLTFIL